MKVWKIVWSMPSMTRAASMAGNGKRGIASGTATRAVMTAARITPSMKAAPSVWS